MCTVHTKTFQAHTGLNQLYLQVFVTTQRCRTEGYPTALFCKGGYGSYGWGQSLSRRWLVFLCKALRNWNRGGHQQVYQWLGVSGAILFWEPAYVAKQAACSCWYHWHNWQQNVACCSFGMRLSSYNRWGTAEEVRSFRALIVQARCGIQVNENYILVYTMFTHVCSMYVIVHT